MTPTPFALMERCFQLALAADADSLAELHGLLRAADWRVRQAAAVALGDRRSPASLEPLLALVAEEDAAPLYTQPCEYGGIPAGGPFPPGAGLPADTPPATAQAWQRRGRLKQAACHTFGEIGVADPRVVAYLHRVVLEDMDYPVRAAAAKALGQLRSPDSLPVLKRAAEDTEFCTRTEALKAIAAFSP